MFNRKLKQKIKMLEEELQASKEDCKAHQLMAESYRKDVKELKRELEDNEKLFKAHRQTYRKRIRLRIKELEASEDEIERLKSKIARKQQPRGQDGRFIKKAEKREFKVGDKVKIVDGFKPEEHRKIKSGYPLFNYEMDKSIGKEGVVTEISKDRKNRIRVDFGSLYYYYHPEWLEHVE